MKKLTGVLCLALIGISPAGCSSNSGRPAAGKSDVADFVLSSKDLDGEYQKDGGAADAKYKGKQIEVTGKLKQFRRLPSGSISVFLEGTTSDVQCFTEDKEPWRKVLTGQTVTLRGAWPEKMFGLTLVDCRIITVTGDPPPTLTANELAKEYGSDKSGTDRKYRDDHRILLTGEIGAIEPRADKSARVFVKTDVSGVKVRCDFGESQSDQAELARLRVGQTIKILGIYRSWEDQEVGVYFPMVLESK
jgi:hypothetical protein